MSMTLTEFLLARIAEDEANLPSGFDCWYKPERYSAECEAKRRIVEEIAAATRLLSLTEQPPDGFRDWLLRTLAVVYADHPDYRDEWRP